MRARVIDPGALRHELVLEAAAAVPDGMGGHAESWVPVATVRAMVEPVSAASRFGGDQTLETVTHRVTIRARADVASGMRFRDGVRMFEIVTAHDPDETGRYLQCATREKGR